MGTLRMEHGSSRSPHPGTHGLTRRARRRLWWWLLVVLATSVVRSDLIADNFSRDAVGSRQRSRATAADWRSVPREDAAANDESPARDDDAPARPASYVPKRSGNTKDPSRYATGNSPRTDIDPGEAFDSRFVTGRQVWRDYDLAPYTARLVETAHPERAVVDWILKQSGTDTWHGDEVAVLAATRGRLRVFHVPEVQARVAEVVERFVRPVQSQVSMRFQFVPTTDLDWRSGLVHLLKPLATGQEGQQVWLIAPEDAALVRERLRVDRQNRQPNQQRVVTYNGQPATIELVQPVNYISGLELTAGALSAYQPNVARLKEGTRAVVTPLWTPNGTGVDLDIKLTTRVVRKLHSAEGVVPVSTGNQNTVVQVPEVSSTDLAQTVRWPTSHVLLISAGVQPGILGSKRGMLGLSPAAAELLVFGELDPPASGRSARRTSAPDARSTGDFAR